MNLDNTQLEEQIIKLLGLERTHHDQLVPSNFEDFQSDWSFTIKQLLDLYATYSKLERIDEVKRLSIGSTPEVREFYIENRINQLKLQGGKDD